MIILGLDIGSSACLFRGSTIVAFCQEERLSGLKKRAPMFPQLAVRWCFQQERITLADVDAIAVSWDCEKYPFRIMGKLLNMRRSSAGSSAGTDLSSVRTGNVMPALEYLIGNSASTVRRMIRDNLRLIGLQGPIPEIVFVDHHLSHARQAYHLSGLTHAAVLVADGSGEEHCVSGYRVDEGSFRKVFGYDIPYSLGWYYRAFTAYLGFYPDRDEGKFMGLAAFGSERADRNPWIERIGRILESTAEGYRLDARYFKGGSHEFNPRYTSALVDFVTRCEPGLRPLSLGENHDGRSAYLSASYVDLAYAVQHHLELALQSLTRRLVKETGTDRLCCAGGVFMNCKANGSLIEAAGLKELYVPPATSDEGACMGAAFDVAARSGCRIEAIRSYAELGPRFSNDEVRAALDSCGITGEAPSDPTEAAARALAQGKTVGWFRGGVEPGARALGNRSILANPAISGIKSHINSRIKYREMWRPYCPSMTAEFAPEAMEGPRHIPFMNIARRATQRIMSDAPDIVHVDGSLRAQTVSAAERPDFHALLARTGKEIGMPVLLNTSFNVRGKPIVCTPLDAVATFYSTRLDLLVLEDIVVRKNGD